MEHPRLSVTLLTICLLAAGCLGVQGAQESDDFEQRIHGSTEPEWKNATVHHYNGSSWDTSGEGVDTTEGPSPGGLPPITFSKPSTVTPPDEYAREPTIEVDQHGNVYISAKAGSYGDDGRLASPFWYSTDNGSTWASMPSPANVHEKMGPALEPDIAIDGENRVYRIDTYYTDNTFSAWEGSPDGPTWTHSLPVKGTINNDDRPWIAATGDGLVYSIARADSGIRSGTTQTAEHVQRSTDGGLTWTHVKSFTDTYQCAGVEASMDEPGHVAFACQSDDEKVHVYESWDRGESWKTITVANYTQTGLIMNWPTLALDGDETPYVTWIDGDRTSQAPSSVHLAYRSETGKWREQNLTPFRGHFKEAWAEAGEDGEVAVVFYGTSDVPADNGYGSFDVPANRSSSWYPYAAVTSNAEAAEPEWHVVRLTEDPISDNRTLPGGTTHPTDVGLPVEFFQATIGPEDRLHVAIASQTGDTKPSQESTTEILYVRQEMGPNVGTDRNSATGDDSSEVRRSCLDGEQQAASTPCDRLGGPTSG